MPIFTNIFGCKSNDVINEQKDKIDELKDRIIKLESNYSSLEKRIEQDIRRIEGFVQEIKIDIKFMNGNIATLLNRTANRYGTDE